MNPATKRFAGVSDLLDMSHGHTYDSVGKSKGLGLVMGYIKHSGLESLVEKKNLPTGRTSELGIQVR